MIRRRAAAFAVPALVVGAWVLLLAWWTHGFGAFTSFAAARVAAGPLPRPAPALPVLDQDSTSWDVAAPSSRYRLVQPMYLRCPDACPVAMATLGLIARDLQDLIPARLGIVSLDVDHDPPVALRAMWVAHGSPAGWRMASLTDAVVEPTLLRMGVWMVRRPDGVINHGLDLLLLDPRGDVIDVIPPDEDEGAIAARVRREIR